MVLARSFLPASFAVALIATAVLAPAQEGEPPPRPASRIHDAGSIFDAGDRPRIAEQIRIKLEALQAETDCDVLVVTVTSVTGTSPRALAEQFAAAWLDPARKGAVLVYDRAGNQFAVSATIPARDTIADYLFSSIEQASQDRDGAEPAESVTLTVNDLAGVFRKYYGEDAKRNHPAIKADRILLGAVTACIVVMLAIVAALHWRAEAARA